MSPAAQKRPRRATFKSVFVKSAALFSLCCALIVTVMATNDARSTLQTARTALGQRSATVVNLLGQQAGGGIHFGRPETVQELFDRTFEDSAGAIAGIVAYDAAGREMARSAAPGARFDEAGLAAAARAAMGSTAPMSAGTGSSMPAPRFSARRARWSAPSCCAPMSRRSAPRSSRPSCAPM